MNEYAANKAMAPGIGLQMLFLVVATTGTVPNTVLACRE